MKPALALTCAVAAWLAAAPIASAQTDGYPSRPITLLVPFPPGGSADVVIRPVAAKVAEALKMSTKPAKEDYDVVVVGGGPAGLAAAVYGASEGLSVLLVEKTAAGGQAGTSSRIEN